MEKNGDSLLEDRDRCEGLLKDYCGGHRREISALVGALEERIPLELRSSWQTTMTPEAMRARLVQRLEDNRGLAPEIANYAVDTWSYALGVGLGRSSDRVQDVPVVGEANGFASGASAADASGSRTARRAPFRQQGPWLPSAGTSAGLSNQNKAIVGGVGLLAVAAMAFALLHHPRTRLPRRRQWSIRRCRATSMGKSLRHHPRRYRTDKTKTDKARLRVRTGRQATTRLRITAVDRAASRPNHLRQYQPLGRWWCAWTRILIRTTPRSVNCFRQRW